MLDLNAAFLSQGYGKHFKEKALKTLPVGSVYSEPGGVNHFLRSAEEPVVVDISGFGPTDRRYFNPADDPENGPRFRENCCTLTILSNAELIRKLCRPDQSTQARFRGPMHPPHQKSSAIPALP